MKTANETANQMKENVVETNPSQPAANGNNSISHSMFQVVQKLVKGSLMGATEVAIDHPLWTIKTRLQSEKAQKLDTITKLKYAMHPKGLYQGVGINMLSMVPITGIQVAMALAASKAAARLIQVNPVHDVPEQGDKNQVNNKLRKQLLDVTSAFVGGAAAATVATPAELVMTQMSTKMISARAALAYIVPNYGRWILWTGYGCTAIRDGIFTIGFLAAPGIVENAISSNLGENSKVKKAAAPIAGAMAAVASHAFDTIKTKQQEMLGNRKLSAYAATKEIVMKNGVFALFRGCVPRAARVVSAVTIMSAVDHEVEKRLQQRKK